MKNEKITSWLILSVVMLTPLYLWRFLIFGLPTNGLEILILLTFVFWIKKSRYDQIRKIIPKTILIGVVLLFGGLVLSALFGGDIWVSFGIIKGWFFMPFIFFLILLTGLETYSQREKILGAILFSGFAVSLSGIWYFLSGQLTYDGRLKGIFLSPNHLAMFLAPPLIIGLFAIRREINNEGWSRSYRFPFLACCLSVIAFTFFLTFSYSAWAALLSGIIGAVFTSPIFSRRAKSAWILGILSVLLLLIIVQPGKQKFSDLASFSERSSLSSRLTIWKASWAIAKDHPLGGIGAGNFQEKYLEYQKNFPPYLEWAVPQPHNLYFAFWLQGGILGIAGFLTIITCAIRIIYWSEKQNSAFQKIALLAIIFYLLLHGMTDTPYWKNDLALVFWTILALGISLSEAPGGKDDYLNG